MNTFINQLRLIMQFSVTDLENTAFKDHTKKIFGRPPLYLRVWMTAPPNPPSQGLDTPLPYTVL